MEILRADGGEETWHTADAIQEEEDRTVSHVSFAAEELEMPLLLLLL